MKNMNFLRKLPIPMDIKAQYPLTAEMEKVKADFVTIKKDGVIATVGRSVTYMPEVQHSAKGIKWFDDSKLIRKGK